MEQKFEQSRFEEVQPNEDNDYLFKMACKSEIDKLNEKGINHLIDPRVKLSTKYQVLCDETSFIGVIKQKQKSSAESKKITIGAISAKESANYGAYQQAALFSMGRGFGGGACAAKAAPPKSYAMKMSAAAP